MDHLGHRNTKFPGETEGGGDTGGEGKGWGDRNPSNPVDQVGNGMEREIMKKMS